MSNVVSYCIISPVLETNHEAILKQCLHISHGLVKDYIWQKEPFNLNLENKGEYSCLVGCSDVGENINDEWFIVYLLFEISKKLPDTVIQVTDEDGEFLLIEAADYLPSWLKPETSQNRVFIHKGDIHIIPYPSNPSEVTIFPTSNPVLLKAALLVRRHDKTKADVQIQNVVMKRISSYPARIYGDFHHVNCFIPQEIVYALHHKPDIVAKAVQTFYERDHLDVKICKKMSWFKAEKRTLARVKFTKHLYSQLMQAKFYPDRNSPWKLPSPNDSTFKASHLGYKLTCGFEIMLARSSSQSQDINEPSGRLWEHYVESLKEKDFFKNEMEGSKHYMELLKVAKTHFQESIVPKSSSSETEDIFRLIEEAKKHEEDIKHWCENLPSEDGDDWMTLTPDELDDMLNSMWKPGQENKGEVDHLTKLVSNMKTFVGNVSSYEGAEVPDNNNTDHNPDDGPIQFDVNTFMQTVHGLLEHRPNTEEDDQQVDTDDNDDDTDEDDPIMSEVMEQMDDELKDSSLAKTFSKATGEDEAVDVDYNLIKNFLESFTSQEGLAGPVSNILQSMGMALPPDDGT